MVASILQIIGLTAVIVGASMEFGASGGIAGAGVGVIYVGLALERD